MGKNLVTPYPVRMPDELRSALEHIAKDNGRSLNAEIVMRLQSTLESIGQATVETDLVNRLRTMETRLAELERQMAELRQHQG